MIEIALLGASGSGKTELAESVQAAYFRIGKHPTPMVIVDRYAEQLDRLQIAVGVWADMYVNMWIHFLRESREAHGRVKNTPIMITCGSMIDTLAYGHLYMEQFQFPAEMSQEMGLLADLGELGLQQLTVFAATRFRKDLVYILPLKTPKGVQREYNKRVDEKIRDMNIRVKLDFVILNGTLKENTDRVIADIREAEKAAA